MFLEAVRRNLVVFLVIFALVGGAAPSSFSSAQAFDPELHDSWRPPVGSPPLRVPRISEKGSRNGGEREEIEEMLDRKLKTPPSSEKEDQPPVAEFRGLSRDLNLYLDSQHSNLERWSKRALWFSLAGVAVVLGARAANPSSILQARMALSIAYPLRFHEDSDYSLQEWPPFIAESLRGEISREDIAAQYKSFSQASAVGLVNFVEEASAIAELLSDEDEEVASRRLIEFLLLRDVIGQRLLAASLSEDFLHSDLSDEERVFFCLFSWDASVIAEKMPAVCDEIPEGISEKLQELSNFLEDSDLPDLRVPVSRWGA